MRTVSTVECVTDEISPNSVSESRMLPGLLTVLAVNKRQFPESEAMKVRATGGQRTLRRSCSLVPLWVPAIQFRSSDHHLTSPFLKSVYGRGHVYHDACIEDKGCL